MNRATAEKLVQHLKLLNEPFNAATLVTGEIADVEERRKIRKALANIICKVYTEIMIPISKDFPDLLPDQRESEGDENTKN